MFNLSFVLAAAFLARVKDPDAKDFAGLIRVLCPYITAFCGVFIANTWGGYFYQMIHTHGPHAWGVGTLLHMALTQWEGPMVSLILLIAVPVLVVAAATAVGFVAADKPAPTQTQSPAGIGHIPG